MRSADFSGFAHASRAMTAGMGTYFSVQNDEYDAFGPWIDEVETREDLPRLYREHPIDFDLSAPGPEGPPRHCTT